MHTIEMVKINSTKGVAFAIAASMLGLLACTKSDLEQRSQAITEEQVHAIANEIAEASLDMDSDRFVASFADDAKITFVPMNNEAALIERKLLKPYLDSVYAKMTNPKYRATNARVQISGDEASYTATVQESFTIDGVREDQETEQKWEVEMREGRARIASMYLKVVSR